MLPTPGGWDLAIKLVKGIGSRMEIELATLLNRYSAEQKSDTPDFILARFLLRCLNAWDGAMEDRTAYYHGKREEYVLVIPTQRLFDLNCYVQGCTQWVPADLLQGELRPRTLVENDFNFKQLIPYVVFRYGDTFFSYQRSTGQGESRLHGNYSIGVGGHINDEFLLDGCWREIREEVILPSISNDLCLVGLINDDTNAVGRVHLGVLFVLDAAGVVPRENTMLNAKYRTAEELKSLPLETWSQHALNTL